MLRSLPGYVPPLVAGVLTLLLVWIEDAAMTAAAESGDALSPYLFLVGLLSLIVPFLVPALWGGATLASRPWWLALAVVLIWLAIALPLFEGMLVWSLACFAAAGLAAALASLFRLRLDAAVLVVSLILAPYQIWAVHDAISEDYFAEVNNQYLETRREMIAGTADDKQIEMTLAAERERLEQASDLVLTFLPGTMGLGIMGLAGILLALVRLQARVFGLAIAPLGIPPFGRWRLPFYLVWILVIGLGLVLTRQETLTAAGWNLVLVVGTLLGLQGAAVQWEVTGRTMGLLPRILYMLIAGFVFLPLVLLGLADQWLDFRKLEASTTGSPPDDSKGG